MTSQEGAEGPHNYFGPQADRYAAHRPQYPAALFHYLATVSPGTRCAWDCATGNGQAALGLADRFARVVATDMSADMLAAAGRHPRVTYHVAQYESGIADGGCDLATVAQALHWLDRDALFAEAERILAPGGVVAMWCYGLLRVEPAIDEVVRVFYEVTLGSFWPAERRLVDDGYRSIALPLDELVPPPFEMAAEWSLERLLGYIRTWSAVQGLVAARGDEALVSFEEALHGRWGNGGLRRRVSWPLSMRIGQLR